MSQTCLQYICIRIVQIDIRLCAENDIWRPRYIDKPLMAKLRVIKILKLSLVVIA